MRLGPKATTIAVDLGLMLRSRAADHAVTPEMDQWSAVMEDTGVPTSSAKSKSVRIIQ